MADFYFGTFAVQTSTGTQAITGVGFQPKALIFFHSIADTGGVWAPHNMMAIGFASSATEERGIGAFENDNAATSVTSRYSSTSILAFPNANGDNTGGEANVQSFDADGFTLNYTTAPATDFAGRMHFLAIGGAEVSAKVVQWTTPLDTAGNKAITGVGFQPDVVFHMATGLVGDVGSAAVHASAFFGAMDASMNQWTNGIYSQDAAVSDVSRRWQYDDRCIIGATVTPVFRTVGISMDSDGFTVASDLSDEAHTVLSLCLSGVSAKLGQFTAPTATTTDTVVTGVGFQPKAMMLTSIGGNSGLQGDLNSALWTLGAAANPLDTAGVVIQRSINASDPTQVDSRREARLGAVPTTGDTFFYVNSATYDADGFTLDWEGTVASNEVFYVALSDGNQPPTAPTLVSPVGESASKNSPVDFDWTHNDPNSDPQASFALVRKRVP